MDQQQLRDLQHTMEGSSTKLRYPKSVQRLERWLNGRGPVIKVPIFYPQIQGIVCIGGRFLFIKRNFTRQWQCFMEKFPYSAKEEEQRRNIPKLTDRRFGALSRFCQNRGMVVCDIGPPVVAELNGIFWEYQIPGRIENIWGVGYYLKRRDQRADNSTTPSDVRLRQFEDEIRTLPRKTEAERQVVQRIGQNIFREYLMRDWEGRCPLTGISDPELLRASHIKPWKDCETDATRLDTYNGLLLSALWDVAFDQCLVTFDAEGQPEFSSHLSNAARAELRWQKPIPLEDKHQTYLAWHRKEFEQTERKRSSCAA